MKRRALAFRLLVFLPALLLAPSADGAMPVRPRPAWAAAAQRLLGRLPVSVSVAVGGRLVYAHAGSVPRVPASNEKLLLSAALLDRFGPGYRIATTVEGARPRGGRVAGDLWLVGHGDPELNDRGLRRLARKLAAAGIRAVRGSVVGVTGTFTRERWAPGWHPIALRYVALPTALAFDGNAGPRGFVLDPERRAAAALTTDLRALGVRVGGPPRTGRRAVEGSLLARIESAPLLQILRRQNRESLNFDAEVLTKLLGAAVHGPPGSIAEGARAIERWVRRHRIRAVARDGSGLSYQDRVTTDGIVELLLARPWSGVLRSTLAAAGRGTLAGRLPGLGVRAKTGTLFEQVSALSGWVWLRRSHRWAAFSILSNGLSKSAAVALEDELVGTIAARA